MRRFGRILFSAIMLGAVICALVLVEDVLAKEFLPHLEHLPEGILYFAPIFAFGATFIGQFCGDILNIEGVANSGFFTFLKRLILFISPALLGLLAQPLLAEYYANGNIETFSSIERGIYAGVLFAPVAALWQYVNVYMTYDGAQKKWIFPLFVPFSYIFGTAFAIGLEYVLDFLDIVSISALAHSFAVLVLTALAIITCIKQGLWPFNESKGFDFHGSAPVRTDRGRAHQPYPDYCRECRYYINHYDKCGFAQQYCRAKGQRVDGSSYACERFRK